MAVQDRHIGGITRWAEHTVSQRRPTGKYQKPAFYGLACWDQQKCLREDSKLPTINMFLKDQNSYLLHVFFFWSKLLLKIVQFGPILYENCHNVVAVATVCKCSQLTSRRAALGHTRAPVTAHLRYHPQIQTWNLLVSKQTVNCSGH